MSNGGGSHETGTAVAVHFSLQVDSALSFLPLSIYQFETTSRAAGSIGVI